MSIETERLLLRKWTETDSEAFAKINTDPDVTRYFPAVYTRERSDEMMRLCNAEIDVYGFSFWAVERKDTNSLIGFVGLHNFDDELDFCPCVEVGWRLAQSEWGKGYATETAKESLRLGFTDFDLDVIYSFTTLSNMRSRTVMQKIGMVNTGNNFDYPRVPVESGLQEYCLYKISKKDWSKSNC